jgi:hypothetical protein
MLRKNRLFKVSCTKELSGYVIQLVPPQNLPVATFFTSFNLTWKINSANEIPKDMNYLCKLTQETHPDIENVSFKLNAKNRRRRNTAGKAKHVSLFQLLPKDNFFFIFFVEERKSLKSFSFEVRKSFFFYEFVLFWINKTEKSVAIKKSFVEEL